MKQKAYARAGVDIDLGNKRYQRTITRADFETLISALVERTVDVCTGVLRKAGATPDVVIMVGGSTRIPLVRRRVDGQFCRVDVFNV